jgi:antitoxin component YwqK of YwqJK toxin-antitoxin module
MYVLQEKFLVVLIQSNLSTKNYLLMSLTKLLFFLIATFVSAISYSQKTIEAYYDYKWRECLVDDARFYSISRNTDSGWYKADYFINLKKLQMAGLYEDKQNTIRNGTFYWFYPNSTLKSVGKYINNKKTGVWLDYFQDKSLKDSLNFKDGNSAGISLGWYNNGAARIH